MAEILVKAVSASHDDQEKDRRGCYKRGDPVVVMPDGHSWGSEEGLPKFVRVTVTDASVDQIRQYVATWNRQIQYTIVGQDLSIDGFRMRISSTQFNAISGEGKITQSMVENYLTNWGASIVSFGDNAVTFDILILNALQSQGFWGSAASNLVITEQQYTQAGGIHRLSIDYSALGLTAARAAFEVGKRKGTILSHNEVTKVVVAEFTRSDARTAFETSVKEKVETTLVRRRFSLPSALLTLAEANGGVHSMTLAELQLAIRDRTLEAF